MFSLALVFAIGQIPAPAPTHQWRLTAEHIADQSLKPQAGKLPGTITGPVAFGKDSAKALVFDGNSKKKHGIVVTDKIADANLPAKDITVEAWVRVEKAMEWGGFVSALQDNGDYERGWVLGFNHNQFCFGVVSAKTKALTYLKSRTHYQTGYWYHVVGTYDGTEQRIYVNGKLAGAATEQSGPILYPPKTWLTIGAYKDDNEHHTLNGQMQDAAIFDIALTPNQIAERFKTRKHDFPEMDALPPVVVDWPTYLRDNLRTGASPEPLKLPLHLAWTHQTRFPPNPAWPEEAKNDYWHSKYSMEERVTYDRAFHLVSVGERVYFGSSSEDAVFCLDAKTGKQVWSYVTEGPVRLAPTIVDEKVLFGSDDGFAYCLNEKDGSLRWKRLLAPSGRRIPGNGRIISAWPVRTDVLVEGGKAFVCAGVFPSQGVYQYTLNLENGEVLSKKTITVTAQGYQQRMFGKLMIGTGRNPQGAFVGDLKAAGRDVDREANSLGKDYPYGFIAAGKLRFAGGDGKVAAFDEETGKKVWEEKVKGKAFSLAAVRGRLFVSTDLGEVSCFTPTPVKSIVVTKAPPPEIMGFRHEAEVRHYGSWVAKVLDELGDKKKGYVLVLGSGDEAFLLSLVGLGRDLQFVIREADEKKLPVLREFVRRYGLANHVTVEHGTWGFGATLPYTDHLFNLIVDPRIVRGASSRPTDEMKRVLRPNGGVAVLGPKAEDIYRADPLPGAGEWTHQYGDAGNSTCSKDDRVDGELMLQWFGKPGPKEMIDRHHRTAASVYKNGRMFVPGEDRVIAVDGYNGTILWDKAFSDSRRVVIFRDASFLCVDDDAVYVASKNSVKLIDPETGKLKSEYPVPADLGGKHWGYLARAGNVLLGSGVKPGSSRQTQSLLVDRTETYYDYVPLVGSDGLFALDPKTGKTLWTYQAKGLIPNPAIAADGETLYFVESRNPKTLEGKLSRAKMADLVTVAGANAVAIDLKTGKEKWRKEVDLKKLDHIVYAVAADGNLILSGSRNSSKDKKTGTVWYDVHVYDAKTGAEKWSVTQDNRTPVGGDHGEQDQHPVVVGKKLFQEPFAYDLDTGSRIEWKWPWVNGQRRAGCGTITASNKTFYFRSDTAGVFDLEEGVAKKLTTETRPGCWVNVIPVGGLVLAPEASSGCSCNFSVQTSLALIPVRKK
jgi:outer membrane protein assembly factor BamB